MSYGDSLKDRIRLHRLGAKIAHETRTLVAPIVAPRRRIGHEEFQLWGSSYRYLSHPYNTTYLNERAAEIPIVAAFLARESCDIGMEFGNVLTHYGLSGMRDVVDKYERAEGVIQTDILDYCPSEPLSYIVSVSTIEHVGWDEKPREPEKVLRAMDYLLSLLAPGGRMLVTAPLGHNPHLDEAVMAGRWVAERQATLVRVGNRRRNHWAPSPTLEQRPYFGRGRGADALWVAQFLAS